MVLRKEGSQLSGEFFSIVLVEGAEISTGCATVLPG